MAFAAAFDQSTGPKAAGIQNRFGRWPLGMQPARTVAALAFNACTCVRKVGAALYASGVAVEAAIDRIDVLRLSQRRRHRRRRIGVMAHGEPRPTLPRI